MGFYEELSKYYDVIFPTNKTKLDFFAKRVNKNSKILDVACGTGNYTIALSKLDHSVDGMDLDEEMINIAREKSRKLNLTINFKISDMREIDKQFVNEKYDLIFCIGNSLVHLQSEDEIRLMLSKVYNKLKNDGTMIIQIINYDRIFRYNIDHLPTITSQEHGVKFIRNYQYNEEQNKMYFNTKIVVEDEGKIREYDNSTPLLPLKSSSLKDMMTEVGFENIKLFGSFNEDEYTTDSYATIVTANRNSI